MLLPAAAGGVCAGHKELHSWYKSYLLLPQLLFEVETRAEALQEQRTQNVRLQQDYQALMSTHKASISSTRQLQLEVQTLKAEVQAREEERR